MAQTTKSAPLATGDGPVFEGTDVPTQSLFDYMEKWRNLDLFLDHFPSVSREQALDALKKTRIGKRAASFTATRRS